MTEQLESVKITLSNAGCPQKSIERAQQLLEAGEREAFIRHLRLCRCRLMEELHERQQQLDCMDYLIRQAKQSENRKGWESR